MRELPDLDFSDEELKLLALVLGFILGTVLIFAARDLMRELVAIEDQAARRRMRDLLEELTQARAGAELKPQPIDSRRAQTPQDIAIEGPRLVAVNEEREATNASDTGTDVATD